MELLFVMVEAIELLLLFVATEVRFDLMEPGFIITEVGLLFAMENR